MPPYPAPEVGKAALLLEGRWIPVTVVLQVVTNLRDRRPKWVGSFWSDEIGFGFHLEGTLRLRLENGLEELIRVVDSSSWGAAEDGGWHFVVRADFLSEQNYKEARES